MAIPVRKVDGTSFRWNREIGYVDNHNGGKVGSSARTMVRVFAEEIMGMGQGDSEELPVSQISTDDTAPSKPETI
ncbi:MAG: hypothetical protein Q8Q20_03815 [bacterium]|nr:hypothetical protein [bacterium]